MDLISYLLGRNSAKPSPSPTPSGHNWSLIGYAEEPDFIGAGYDYAKTIYDNYDSATTDWQNKFLNDTDLIFLPLVDTSNVTTMRSAFNGCASLLVVPAIDTSSVTTMRGMFQYCNSLRDIDFTNFDTSNVTTMETMFRRNFGLIKITPPFDTSKVTTMANMFEDCLSLTEVDLSSFTSEALTNTSNMFNNCRLLTKIDLRGMEFTNVGTYSTMFGLSSGNGIPDDCLIIVKDATQKTWITGHFTRLTNVKTVAEL